MRPFVCAALLLALAAPAAAFDWPVSARALSRVDLLARFRWDNTNAWRASVPAEARSALSALDASAPSAETLAARAVLMRLLGREEDSRASLSAALALSPAALDDPDVALTAAWLAARGGDFAQAATTGARALSRMSPSGALVIPRREPLVLEVARWSMARGPVGLADAAALIRAHAAGVAVSPLLRATLALCLVRQGRVDEARWLIAPVASALHPDDGLAQLPGALASTEGDAAIGVALRLGGRSRDALAPLERASRTPVEPWRVFQARELELARRP